MSEVNRFIHPTTTTYTYIRLVQSNNATFGKSYFRDTDVQSFPAFFLKLKTVENWIFSRKSFFIQFYDCLCSDDEQHGTYLSYGMYIRTSTISKKTLDLTISLKSETFRTSNKCTVDTVFCTCIIARMKSLLVVHFLHGPRRSFWSVWPFQFPRFNGEFKKTKFKQNNYHIWKGRQIWIFLICILKILVDF